MDDNVFEKLKSMINNGNIPDDLQSIISNMNSSNKTSDSPSNNKGISPEAISSLMSMLNSNSGASKTPPPAGNNPPEEKQQHNDETSNNFSIDFETIMKFKTIMDKMNSKDDPRSKLLISLKPYLKESRKNKIDQYVQFLNMSKLIDMFGKSNGVDKS